MVQIIQRNDRPGFAERIARGFESAGNQLPAGLKQYSDSRQKEAELTQKRLKGLPRSMDSYLKKFHDSYLSDEKRYNSLSDRAKEYVMAGYSDEDAIRAALGDMRGETEGSPKSKAVRGTADSDKFVGGWLGQYLDPAKKAIQEDPSILAREAPVAGLKSAENLAALDDPLSAALRLVFPSKNKPITASGALGEQVRKGVDPTLHEGADRVSDIGSFLLDLFTPLPKGAKGTAIAEKGAAKLAPKLAEREIPSLAKGVVSKEVPVGANAARMERLAPEGKLFKRAEQEAVREQQLKMFPKYAEEISADAAERAARLEAKMPKTAVGEAGVAKRMAVAEAELPKAKDLYQKAVARVRGLENELARGIPEAQKAATESLYNMAVKELNDAEFYLKTVVNNAKTGEARVGVDQMRQAARNKMLKIEDDVLSGHEPKISLKDYNPETVKKAKALEKKKPLPASRHEDYFTQVHEGYANEYRARIADLDREIEKLKRVPGMAPLQRGLQINREKDVLKKLIDHIDAENAIHRHKMALRETGQRQVAKERLGQYTKQAGEQRVKDLAKEALKSPEKAVEATEAAFQDAAAQSTNAATKQKILQELPPVQKKMEQIAAGEGKIGSVLDEVARGPSDVKNAHKWGSKIVDDLKEVFNSLRGSGPTFFNTRLGGDFLIGAGTEFTKELFKEFDIPLSHSAALAAALGRPGRGSVYRALISSLTRAGINKFKKERYKRALASGDDESLIEFRESYPAKLRKEAIEEYQKSRGSL